MENARSGYIWTQRLLRRAAILLAVGGTCALVLSLFWNLYQRHEAVLESARIQARSAIQEDDLYRHWNVEHGGVYRTAPGSEPPDPDIEVIGRSEMTRSGTRLQLVHHAGMTRMAHRGLKDHDQRIEGRVTSVTPLRRHNAPTEWERSALAAFDRGADEMSTVERSEDGEEYLRLMRPLRTEQDCLVCHAAQGYRLGDARGGVSFAVPLTPLQSLSAPFERALIWAHAGLWLLGMGSLAFGIRTVSRTERRRRDAEDQRGQALRTAATRYERLEEQGRELAVQKGNLEALLANLDEGIMLLDLDQRVVVANTALGRLFGESAAELEVRTLAELPLQADGRLRSMLQTACDRAAAHEDWTDRAYAGDHAYTVTTVRDPNGETFGALGIIQDLSPMRSLEREQKELQEQLFEKEKLAIVGILAGNLAQELNTPLRTILLEAQRLQSSTPLEAGDVAVVEQQVHLCQDIVRRLLEFSHVSGARPLALDLREPAQRLASLAEAGLRLKGVSLDVQSEDDVPRVQADAEQIEQVLMNLIWNAADAMPDGGTVEVRLVRSGDEAQVLVSDRGPGIPAEHRDKIFEPFFTTKPTGKGTGLGLSICRRLVEEHRGRIDINERSGGGTVVTLSFPSVGEYSGWRPRPSASGDPQAKEGENK